MLATSLRVGLGSGEAARRAGLSTVALLNAVRRGELAATPTALGLLFDPVDLEDWIRRRRERPSKSSRRQP